MQASFTWEPIRTIAEDAVLRHTMNMNNLLTTLPKYAQTGQGMPQVIKKTLLIHF